MARGGDEDDLLAFCHAEHRRLVGLLVVVVGDVPVAEELAQEALARLCANWSSVRRMDNPRAWLRRVALNLATSRFRRRQAEWRANRRHGVVDVHVPADPATAVAVRDAVRRLPPRQRTVIALRYFAGLDVAETAREMRCAEGTVKSLTNRAVVQLRAHLSDTEEVRCDHTAR